MYEKVSETRELDYDVLHKDELDSTLILESVDLSRNDVIIKGAAYKLEQVATVKALVDIEKISKLKVGNYTLEKLPLIAYDANGQPIDVEIVPGAIDAQLKITSPSKEVPIQVIPVNVDKIAFGRSIKSLESSITKVTIYGEESVINNIDSIPVEIDVKDLASNKTFNVNIEKPSGVRAISSKTVSIDVTLDDVISKEISNVNISIVNLDSSFKAYAVSKEDSLVTAIVNGSSASINALDPSTVKAVVDLSGYDEPGIYDVVVHITGDDLRLTYSSKTEKVRIKIEKK